MTSIANKWWNEDRRDLFWSAEVIVLDSPDATRLGNSFDTILNDLELYDDPRQGAGAWLYEDELPVAEALGEQLHNFLGDTTASEAGAVARDAQEWSNIQGTAAKLMRLMEANGDFTR